MIEALARLVAPAMLSLVSLGLAADESRVPMPDIPPAARGDRCVEPTDVMRREHMDFLMHQRDETVHEGIRGAKHSLVGCIGCHVRTDPQGDPVPVDAQGQFCESCHGFAGVEMDCFECHAAVPAEAGALPAWMSVPSGSMARVALERRE